MSDTEIQMTDQIWELSREQAQEVLDAFLAAEAETFPSLTIGAVELDYSADSVIQAAHHIVAEIKAGRLDGEQQKVWFARMGYYLGESLRRAKPSLSWGLGDPEYAFANHPVIVGFADDSEGPVITICKNIIEAVVEGLSPPERIKKGVSAWFDRATMS